MAIIRKEILFLIRNNKCFSPNKNTVSLIYKLFIISNI